jgi:pimeloyl-ACP methyl ester carboxylesterase
MIVRTGLEAIVTPGPADQGGARHRGWLSTSWLMARIGTRTLVLVADDDEVRLEHAVEMYRCVPDAELAVVPGPSHGLLVEKTDLCNQIIVRFLAEDPVPTLAPIRRRGSPAGRA